MVLPFVCLFNLEVLINNYRKLWPSKNIILPKTFELALIFPQREAGTPHMNGWSIYWLDPSEGQKNYIDIKMYKEQVSWDSPLNNIAKGQQDGSAGNVLSSQTLWSEFDPQNPHKKPNAVVSFWLS